MTMMNLQEQLNQAIARVDEALSEREKLVEALSLAQRNLDANTSRLDAATKKRDEIRGMMSIVPPPREKSAAEAHMEERQAVFAAMRQIPNVWIAPQGLSVLAGVDDDITAAILRRAASLDGVPVEHNGKRGRASMYKWVGK